MTKAAYDAAFLSKNSYLSELDYGSISRRFLNCLTPFRINTIRKDLEFKPMDYDKYCVEYANFQATPELENGIKLDIELIPLFLLASFGTRFFPNFENEYYRPMWSQFSNIDKFAILDGQQVLPNENYRSLSYTAWEVETMIKNKYQKSGLAAELSPDLEITSSFLIPKAKGDMPGEDMTLACFISICL